MSDEEALLEERIVELTDEETGEAIPMQVFLELEVEGKTYALLTPKAPVVQVMKATDAADEADEDALGSLDEVDPEDFAPLQKAFDEALRDYGVKVALRAGEYTLEGEPSDDLYEDCELLTVVIDDFEEEWMVLVEVDTGSERFLLCEPEEPEIYAVEMVGDTPRRLEDAELEELLDAFEAALAEFEEGDEEEEA